MLLEIIGNLRNILHFVFACVVICVYELMRQNDLILILQRNNNKKNIKFIFENNIKKYKSKFKINASISVSSNY